MLRVDESRLVKEMDKLIEWLEADRPEVLCLSTALQAGMIRELKKRLGVKVICCFQGEDEFLDALPEPFRERVLAGTGASGCVMRTCWFRRVTIMPA